MCYYIIFVETLQQPHGFTLVVCRHGQRVYNIEIERRRETNLPSRPSSSVRGRGINQMVYAKREKKKPIDITPGGDETSRKCVEKNPIG